MVEKRDLKTCEVSSKTENCKIRSRKNSEKVKKLDSLDQHEERSALYLALLNFGSAGRARAPKFSLERRERWRSQFESAGSAGAPKSARSAILWRKPTQ